MSHQKSNVSVFPPNLRLREKMLNSESWHIATLKKSILLT